MEDKNGIYIMFCGGLGNKMFQIAAGYVASKKYNCTLYIPRIEDKNHHGEKVNYSENIFKHFGVHLSQLNYPNNYIRNDIYQFMISTEAYTLDNLQIPITFNQYFQYYPPLKMYENDIINLFKEGLTSYKINYPTFILEESAFIHIRRGDYLKYPDRHPVMPLSYYVQAINLLRDNVRHFFVFSDDIEWVKKQDLFKYDSKIICIDSKDELYTLAFMSKCHAGAICANSSFSWWGAFLGAYEKRNPVFVPRDWIRNCKVDCLFPDEWIKLY